MRRQPTEVQSAARRGAARPILLLFALLAAVPALGAGYRVEVEGQELPVDSRRFDRVEYLSVGDLATALGGRLREDTGSGNFILDLGETRFILSARDGLASIDGRLITLKHPNRTTGKGELWVSPEFIDLVLEPYYTRSVRRAGRRIFIGGAPPAHARLRTSHDAAGTRAVIEFNRPVRVDHQTGPTGVKVRVHDGPLTVEGLPRAVQGDVVTAVWFEPADSGNGGTFEFEPGPRYNGANISHLEDPYRVIIDFFSLPDSIVRAQKPLLPAGDDVVGQGIRTVIIDPGHGGSEVGATGPSGLFEKDVVLDIARRTASLLRRRLGVEVILTREVDKVMPLDDRAGIANNAQADLFISIHANASRRSRASGAETYFLDRDATDEASALLAASENASSGAGPETTAADGLDMVLWDMAQLEHRIQSSELAETIQQELNDLLDTRDRGVRQAPFRVLMGITMPAVLVEVAFISNPDEERALRTSEFRDRIAQALAASITRYKRSYEDRLEEGGASRALGQGAP